MTTTVDRSDVDSVSMSAMCHGKNDFPFSQRVLCKALNTSNFFGFRFFGFHFEYGLSTDETYSRRQISTGTKFEVSHLHNIFVDFGQSGPSMD